MHMQAVELGLRHRVSEARDVDCRCRVGRRRCHACAAALAAAFATLTTIAIATAALRAGSVALVAATAASNQAANVGGAEVVGEEAGVDGGGHQHDTQLGSQEALVRARVRVRVRV